MNLGIGMDVTTAGLDDTIELYLDPLPRRSTVPHALPGY